MTRFDPADLLKRLPERLANLHLTFNTPEGVSTFASDNAGEFRHWWVLQCAKLSNPDRKHYVALIRHEFTPAKDPITGLPIKRVSSCFFKGGVAVPLSSNDTRRAYETDARTGRPLPPMTDFVYVDFA